MSQNFYVTSPIYYVNDVPHIGHAYTSIACDVIARFNRLNNHNVFFLTGTDEHGQKVEKSALAKEKSPQQFCDEVSQKFRDLSTTLNLSNDDFIRTTELRHKKTVEKIWQIMLDNGFIYKGSYQGWYAVRDEAFYSEDELIDGKAPTGAQVQWHSEESYFFRLSAFQDKLLALYEAVPDFIRPESRYNEVVSFVKSGLKDLSISRTSFSWGIKVPNDEKHVIYVWLDALTNYLSALDFADDNKDNNKKYQQFWVNGNKSPLHIVGKDIVRFHCVYWPAFLMACNLNVPYQVFAHGWWTNDGQKISKSLGNVINPDNEIEWLKSRLVDNNPQDHDHQKYGIIALDYFRYFLMREVVFGNDGDYSRINFTNRINSELANNIGNLVQRCLTMVVKNCDGEISGDYQNLRANFQPFKNNYFQAFDNLQFDKALEVVIEFANLINKNFNDQAPWNLKKEHKIDLMRQCLFETCQAIRLIAILLQPFMPSSAKKILDLIIYQQQSTNPSDNFQQLNNFSNNLKISNPQPIFPRI
ncbi:methionine--tRNA ligase [Alphaproteobacteria bacterium]|nr:methionine--tRNA ligase [Alphaproteobacteria bacterium]